MDTKLVVINVTVKDKSGNLIVISYSGKGIVYTFKPDGNFGEITLLHPEPSEPRPGMTPVLPVDYWRNENDFPEAAQRKKPFQFVSLDRSTFIPAGEDFVTGQLYYGSKIHDVLRAFGLYPASAGQQLFVSDESEQKTYSSTVGEDGTLTNLRPFVDRGGESVAADTEGNVYIATGEIYIYNSAGKLIGEIDVPERPSQLRFGGLDRKTLLIGARSSLYSAQLRVAGR